MAGIVKIFLQYVKDLEVQGACVAPFACSRKVTKRSAGNASEPVHQI